jgi:hypothetical protein
MLYPLSYGRMEDCLTQDPWRLVIATIRRLEGLFLTDHKGFRLLEQQGPGSPWKRQQSPDFDFLNFPDILSI